MTTMIISTPMSAESWFYKQFVDSMPTADKPVWIGVDWAAGSGMNRGEVIKSDGKVIYVRFKTVLIQRS